MKSYNLLGHDSAMKTNTAMWGEFEVLGEELNILNKVVRLDLTEEVTF